jgi:hypothetical protein
MGREMNGESDPECKTCGCCGELKPLEQFRRRYADSDRRHSQCDECAAAYARERRAAQFDRELLHFASEFRQRLDRPTKLEALVEGIMSKFGGTDRFVKRLFNAVEAAEQSNRPHVATRFYILFVEAVWAATEARKGRRAKWLRNISTLRLEREVRREIKKEYEWSYDEDDPPPM